MLPRGRVVASLFFLVCVVPGCSRGEEAALSRGEEAAVSQGANGDCVRAWNAAGNASNRSAAATGQSGWSVEVAKGQVSHPDAESGLTSETCSYFLYSPARWKTYGGVWESDGDLRWGIPPTIGGRRTPEQKLERPNAILVVQGKLARIPTGDGAVSGREWRAVIDDWFDGEFDRAHRCAAVREAITHIPSDMRVYPSVIDDLRRYAQRVC